MRIVPKSLKTGDTIGLIAPGSPPDDPAILDKAICAIENLGFKVSLGKHIKKRTGFLAGTDAERASDVNEMFKDRKVSGIFCLRGGYGVTRILDLINYKIIRKNPKVLLGFSDITALQLTILKMCNLVTYHGPLVSSHFIDPSIPRYTIRSFTRTLINGKGGGIRAGASNGIKIIRAGKVTGEIIGGNLTLICNLIGTKWEPNFKRKILFFEDVGEAPYRIDRSLTYLINAGVLSTVKGIALGRFANCTDPKSRKSSEYRQTVYDVVKERLYPLKIPVVYGLPFGHVPHNATIPVGGHATLDATSGDLKIT